MSVTSSIIEEYTILADKRLALTCRIMVGFMIAVGILNYVGIFIIDPVPLYTTVAISIFNFMLPTWFYNVFKLHHTWTRYLILFLMVIQTGIQYASLSYHVILMISFPIILSCLYDQRKYVVFTSIVSFPVIVVSHLVAYQLHVVPDEPLVTMKGTIFYGMLPRMLELGSIITCCYFIAAKIQDLLHSLEKEHEMVYEEQQAVIASLSEIIESQSQHTGQHVKRVAEYTAILCRKLGFPEETVRIVSRASMLHDVGKIIVPLEILDKPGKLTDKEFEVIKEHVKHGRKMLENTKGRVLQTAADIAYEHHERWDGNGYLGKKGEDINLYARCVSLADVFDALVSSRPYKKAWKPEAARVEIISQRGRQFDPKVVDAFQESYDDFLKVMEKYPDRQNEITSEQ